MGMALIAMSPTAFFIGCSVFRVLCTGLAWFHCARPGAANPS
ncbi:hypothetical protein [Cryobacterium sp. CAN_C2]